MEIKDVLLFGALPIIILIGALVLSISLLTNYDSRDTIPAPPKRRKKWH